MYKSGDLYFSGIKEDVLTKLSGHYSSLNASAFDSQFNKLYTAVNNSYILSWHLKPLFGNILLHDKKIISFESRIEDMLLIEKKQLLFVTNSVYLAIVDCSTFTLIHKIVKPIDLLFKKIANEELSNARSTYNDQD